MSDDLYTVTIRLPAGLNDVQASFFAEDVAFGGDHISVALGRDVPVSEGDYKPTGWSIQWLRSGIADPDALADQLNYAIECAGFDLPTIMAADIECAVVDPNTNWLEQSYQAFPPFNVGEFYIHGSHSTEPAPTEQRALQIDAATAFGSGEHGTTAGCLLLLEHLRDQGVTPARVLDMGCGSGILGIAAWMIFQCPVIASDIDPESARVTAEHGRINAVPVWDEAPTTNGMAICAGDGFRLPLVQNNAPFDIVIANILPAPLLAMASDLVAATGDNGYVILSGILNEQADEVENAYIAINLRPVMRMVRGDWTSLLMKKS